MSPRHVHADEPTRGAVVIRAGLVLLPALGVVGGVGFALVRYLAGDGTGALAGGLLAALSAATLAVARMVALSMRCLQAGSAQVDQLRYRLDLLEAGMEVSGVEVPGVEVASVGVSSVEVDFCAVGAGDPVDLVAAEVPRDGFPRVVRPAIPARRDGLEPLPALTIVPRPQDFLEDEMTHPAAESAAEYAGSPAETEYLFREALAMGDLPCARARLADLNGRADAERVARLGNELDAAAARQARRLREEFRLLVQARNFTAALLKGEELAAAFPDSRWVAEFEELRPHLERLAGRPRPRRASAG